jgi:hypothetical protein
MGNKKRILNVVPVGTRNKHVLNAGHNRTEYNGTFCCDMVEYRREFENIPEYTGFCLSIHPKEGKIDIL